MAMTLAVSTLPETADLKYDLKIHINRLNNEHCGGIESSKSDTISKNIRNINFI